MVTRAPREDPRQDRPQVAAPRTEAAGNAAVGSIVGQVLGKLGAGRSARTLLRLNQKDGFDCPGCAWPDPDHRHTFEFCENGVKAVAEEATPRRVDAEFFAAHPVADLGVRSDYWLGQQGRLTEPMLLDEGGTHYRPVGWHEAFDIIATELAAGAPDDAVFYTSGRTSNEAAFLYQLFARAHGTNNLPDCSNMCHESSGAALSETIGIGKGSVLLEDIYRSDLIVICGQNPGTNHPRMLMALERAKRAGARIVSVNPLPEPGLMEFKNPQRPSSYVGRGTELADRFLHLRVGGDQALFAAVGRLLLEAEDAAPGTVLDHDFIAEHTSGFDSYATHVRGSDRAETELATGLAWSEIEDLALDFRRSRSTIICWAMGITQHRDAVPTIREFVNVLLLQGNIGRPGAGVCPVRGHSNVQGDRTMGIWEQMPQEWLDRLGAEFDFAPPRAHGLDTVDTIRAMRDGRVRVFMGMGGNFVRATPDSEVTEAALRNCSLTVQVSTKLNRSHTVTGRRALILPTLGRTERDLTRGHEQVVSVEDSMGVVHASRGRLRPASPHLRSEVDIVCGLADRVLGPVPVDWGTLASDYSRIRDHIARVVPGHEDYDYRVTRPGGFVLPHPPRDSRSFPTPDGRAQFTVNQLQPLEVPPGRLLLQTIRSHDQFNTTIYGLDDRYRGIKGGRRVVLVNPLDLADLGVVDGSYVDLVSEWRGTERTAPRFRVVGYPTARGCAAAYFPETNVLVALDNVASTSNTPASKEIVVRLEPATP
ncbi:MAG TPA: FdhF/YdeP family oxidoreductase [Candidatus Nanopelagicales bacterium]|nr:FdhF/YdeP family oxidoreductase [Candidatus Nanopelagicales bacterium]